MELLRALTLSICQSTLLKAVLSIISHTHVPEVKHLLKYIAQFIPKSKILMLSTITYTNI